MHAVYAQFASPGKILTKLFLVLKLRHGVIPRRYIEIIQRGAFFSWTKIDGADG